MKPSPEQVREWEKQANTRLDPNWGVVHNTGTTTLERFAELAAQWGAAQAIKNHILLNALESAKAHMQDGQPHTLTMHITRKGDALVADGVAVTKGAQQTTEPELPEAALYRCEACRKTGLMIHCSDPINCGGMVSYFTATQMHDHYQAGVRAGMGQSQDAKRLDWVESQGNGSGWLARNSITNRGYRIHNDKDAKHKTVREAIDSAMQGGQK